MKSYETQKVCSSVICIYSSSSDRKIVISYDGDEHLTVKVESFDINIIKQVWLYTDGNEFDNFFQKIGDTNLKWDRTFSWKSVEGDFSISATCDSLGKVTFKISLEGLQGTSEEWRVQVNIESDLGALEKIARQSKSLFNGI